MKVRASVKRICENCKLVRRRLRVRRHHGAAQAEAIGAADGGERPVTATVDGMVEAAALDLHPALGRRLLQHLHDQIFRSSCEVSHEFIVGNAERRAIKVEPLPIMLTAQRSRRIWPSASGWGPNETARSVASIVANQQ